MYHVIYTFFGKARYKCGKFHLCRICATEFMEGGFLPPTLPAHMGPAPKRPILNRVKSEATFQRFSERFCRIGNKKKWRRFYFSKNNAVTRKGFR